MRSPRIPRSKIYYTGNERRYMDEAMEAQQLSGDGKFTELCRNWLKDHTRCFDAFLTHSGTAALEMAALLADVGPGDEVIMPSFTFSSTATAFALRGATPVFADIDPDTLCLSPESAAAAITPRTRAIVPVDYAGYPSDMSAFVALGEEHGLVIIEDAAQALGSTYKGKPVGALGHLVCLSFHESKNIQCGEGGALLVNDPAYVERAAIIREKGTNRSAFMHGQVDKYTWMDIGSSYLPSELTAAFLLAQLEDAEHITESRRKTCNLYDSLLAPLHEAGRLVLFDREAHPGGNCHIYWILTGSLEERLALTAFLKKENILSFFHYVPLHSAPAGRRLGRAGGSLEVTDSVAERLLRLPLHVDMPEEDIRAVAEAVREFYGLDPARDGCRTPL